MLFTTLLVLPSTAFIFSGSDIIQVIIFYSDLANSCLPWEEVWICFVQFVVFIFVAITARRATWQDGDAALVRWRPIVASVIHLIVYFVIVVLPELIITRDWDCLSRSDKAIIFVNFFGQFFNFALLHYALFKILAKITVLRRQAADINASHDIELTRDIVTRIHNDLDDLHRSCSNGNLKLPVFVLLVSSMLMTAICIANLLLMSHASLTIAFKDMIFVRLLLTAIYMGFISLVVLVYGVSIESSVSSVLNPLAVLINGQRIEDLEAAEDTIRISHSALATVEYHRRALRGIPLYFGLSLNRKLLITMVITLLSNGAAILLKYLIQQQQTKQ